MLSTVSGVWVSGDYCGTCSCSLLMLAVLAQESVVQHMTSLEQLTDCRRGELSKHLPSGTASLYQTLYCACSNAYLYNAFVILDRNIVHQSLVFLCNRCIGHWLWPAF
jgi:hypothetical protein